MLQSDNGTDVPVIPSTSVERGQFSPESFLFFGSCFLHYRGIQDSFQDSI